MPARLTSNRHEELESQKRFGVRLREAREEKGLTQVELGVIAGYTNGWISNIERGEGVPTTTFVRRMERALECDLGYSSLVSRPSKGDVGDWGVTATEAAGYIGLSRTRVYELMRTEQLAWENVDGYRRVRIAELAGWVVEDGVSRGLIGAEDSSARKIKEEGEIKKWLLHHRAYMSKEDGE